MEVRESMRVWRGELGSIWVGRGGLVWEACWEACWVVCEGGSARASEVKQADVEGFSMVLEKGEQVHGV